MEIVNSMREVGTHFCGSIGLLGKLKSQIHNYGVSLWKHFHSAQKKSFLGLLRPRKRHFHVMQIFIVSSLSVCLCINKKPGILRCMWKKGGKNERNLVVCGHRDVQKASLNIEAKIPNTNKAGKKHFKALCETNRGKKINSTFHSRSESLCVYETPSGPRAWCGKKKQWHCIVRGCSSY